MTIEGTDKMKNVRIRVYNSRPHAISAKSDEYAGMIIRTADLNVYYNDGGECDVRFKLAACLPYNDNVQFETLLGEVNQNIIRICSTNDTHEDILDAIKSEMKFNKHGYIVGVK